MVTFILDPMIIPGSISVIGLDMIWDPETDSQSLSMSGFPAYSNQVVQTRQKNLGQTNRIKSI